MYMFEDIYVHIKDSEPLFHQTSTMFSISSDFVLEMQNLPVRRVPQRRSIIQHLKSQHPRKLLQRKRVHHLKL